DVERIALRLRLDREHDAGAAVQAAVGPLVLGRALDTRDLAEAHEVPVRAARDHEIAKVFLGFEADECTQRELARARLEPAGRQLDVLSSQSLLDVGDREPALREPNGRASC